MVKRIFLGLCCLFVMLAAIGCGKRSSEDFSENHVQYIAAYGWTIHKMVSEETIKIDFYPERLETLRIAELELEPYRGKELFTTSYELKEKQTTGDKMFVTLYELEGKIIGGHGSLAEWSPGAFALSDKERLINDGILNP